MVMCISMLHFHVYSVTIISSCKLTQNNILSMNKRNCKNVFTEYELKVWWNYYNQREKCKIYSLENHKITHINIHTQWVKTIIELPFVNRECNFTENIVNIKSTQKWISPLVFHRNTECMQQITWFYMHTDNNTYPGMLISTNIDSLNQTFYLTFLQCICNILCKWYWLKHSTKSVFIMYKQWESNSAKTVKWKFIYM